MLRRPFSTYHLSWSEIKNHPLIYNDNTKNSQVNNNSKNGLSVSSSQGIQSSQNLTSSSSSAPTFFSNSMEIREREIGGRPGSKDYHHLLNNNDNNGNGNGNGNDNDNDNNNFFFRDSSEDIFNPLSSRKTTSGSLEDNEYETNQYPNNDDFLISGSGNIDFPDRFPINSLHHRRKIKFDERIEMGKDDIEEEEDPVNYTDNNNSNFFSPNFSTLHDDDPYPPPFHQPSRSNNHHYSFSQKKKEFCEIAEGTDMETDEDDRQHYPQYHDHHHHHNNNTFLGRSSLDPSELSGLSSFLIQGDGGSDNPLHSPLTFSNKGFSAWKSDEESRDFISSKEMIKIGPSRDSSHRKILFDPDMNMNIETPLNLSSSLATSPPPL